MGDVVTALEGPFALLECLDDPSGCELTDVCSQRPVWRRLRSAIQEALGAVALSELADEMNEARERPAYSI